MKGPFANRTVNLGPVEPSFTDLPLNPRKDGLGYNPRCLKRELSSFVSKQSVTDHLAVDLITQQQNITGFQNTLESGVNPMGVHTGGHVLVGASPGQNLYVSPGDPHFWLHHAYIDRIWWIWQNQKPAERRYVIGGTRTFQNDPPSPSSTLEDLMDLGVNAGSRTLNSVTSTLEDGLCYVYG